MCTDLNLIYKLYSEHLTPTQTIDDVLLHTNISHLAFRQYCVDNNKPLPSPTPGLALEIKMEQSNIKRYKLLSLYHLTQHELTHCLLNDYYNLAQNFQLMLAQMRSEGATELDISNTFGPRHTDKDLLAEEITMRIQQGEKQRAIAELYRITPGRVSQLKQLPTRVKPKLTQEQKQEIRARRHENALDLAKEYGVARNTIYVIWNTYNDQN